MERSWFGIISLMLAFNIAMVLSESQPTCAKVDWRKVNPENWLRQSQIHNIEALLKRREQATKEDHRAAQQILKVARKDAKRHGESILAYPTVEGFLGRCTSLARSRYPRETCEVEIVTKIGDFEKAMKLFETAFKFHYRLGRKSDALQETIERSLLQLFAAQKDVFVKMRKCLQKKDR
jgi:hypothetical protein